MTDKYFGWQPIAVPGYAMIDDYVESDPSDPNRVYEPTNWGYDSRGTNIVSMWNWVQKESDERAYALAEMWRRTSVLLQSTRENLQRHADALNDKWRSPAGQLFMERVGSALHSLDEWKRIADDNQTGLEQLGNKIQQAQRALKPLWEEYLRADAANMKKAEENKGFQAWDLVDSWVPGVDGNNEKSPEEIQRDFHDRAVAIVKPLAETFIDVYIEKISRGGIYKGPINAAIADPSQIPGPSRPTAPSGPRPSAPAISPQGTAPTRPNLDGAPTNPEVAPTPPPATPPGLPGGVGLAGTTAAPLPPPSAPPTPVATSPGGSPPSTPVVPGIPNGLGRAGGAAPARPTLPGANGPSRPSTGGPGGNGRGSAPNRPTLPGSRSGGAPGTGSRPTGRGAPSSDPRLPGRGSGSSAGSRPMTGRGTPSSSPRLPGNTLSGRAGGSGVSGRPAPPPSLGGTRGTPPTKPGNGLTQPGRSAQPQLGGRGATGQPRTSAPSTGPQPALGGRHGESATPVERDVDYRPVDPESWEYDDGDGLWATDINSGGAVEAPAEHRPKQQGRVLGQG